MNTGRRYDFQLSWNLRNLEQAKKRLKSEFLKNDPEFRNIRVTIVGEKDYNWSPDMIMSLITRNSGPYHNDYYTNFYDKDDWKPLPVPPFDYTIDHTSDKILCNISLELSKCPEKQTSAVVFVFLEKVADASSRRSEK